MKLSILLAKFDSQIFNKLTVLLLKFERRNCEIDCLNRQIDAAHKFVIQSDKIDKLLFNSTFTFEKIKNIQFQYSNLSKQMIKLTVSVFKIDIKNYEISKMIKLKCQICH